MEQHACNTGSNAPLSDWRCNVKSRRNCQPCHGPRRSPVALNLDPLRGEQLAHRRLKIGLPQTVLYGLVFLGERP